MLSGKRNILKKYGGKTPEFDESIFETLFAREEDNENALRQAYIDLDNVKTPEEGDAAREKVKSLKANGKQINKEINAAMKESKAYSKTVKAYTQAEKLVRQCEDYKHFAEIEAKYDEAKQRIEEQEKKEAELAAAELEQRRLDKEARKNAKKK